ncbi:DUF2254 domain-containing protein [Sulfitobacter sabulilitoris]|uniref:DUF2254 domain-containing protein n=1 Tax=Sulfitobacter sabulilitoris TaxID=2562655 RepID=A0A5S3QBJ0_9RHOB|nr:DUF2254 domain-containing protein [Sulfitobacter sabulilitoris]TMM54452.1 DUF2254 domain-containing protein [Sulfitobacter sabulilitoris]
MENLNWLPDTLLRKARHYSRQLWVRVVAMGLLAILVLGLTQIIEWLVPDQMGSRLTGAAADRLLQIIANAMLAVTTFSLTVMVTVYRSSSTQWTPRVHRLIMQDPVTQNTLAAFIGAYVYALIAIIMRELGVYVDERALVLFAVTVLVLAFIVFNLVRWVLHLQTFGSLIDTTRQVEGIARRQFAERLATPCLGARPLIGAAPDNTRIIRATQSGYIQHIYPQALDKAARMHGVDLYLTRDIGSFVFLNEPLVQVRDTGAPPADGCDDDTLARAVRDNVVLDDVRSYDQDPRFGLMVMGEIASKALSPGINDPGTAIDVITRVGRILSDYSDETQGNGDLPYPNLWVHPLEPTDLIEDGFGSLARDGAAVIEVQQRLQSTLTGLMHHPDKGLQDAARIAAGIELRRAWSALKFDHDRARLRRSVAEAVWNDVADDLNPRQDQGTDRAPERD